MLSTLIGADGPYGLSDWLNIAAILEFDNMAQFRWKFCNCNGVISEKSIWTSSGAFLLHSYGWQSTLLSREMNTIGLFANEKVIQEQCESPLTFLFKESRQKDSLQSGACQQGQVSVTFPSDG